MKVSRHAKIIELISQYDIETQEELAEYLNNAGFKVSAGCCIEVMFCPLLVQLRIAKVKRLHKPWTSSTSILPKETGRPIPAISLMQISSAPALISFSAISV